MKKTVCELFAGVGGFRCGLNNINESIVGIASGNPLRRRLSMLTTVINIILEHALIRTVKTQQI